MVYMKRKEKGPGKSGREQALFPDPLRPADLLGSGQISPPPLIHPENRGWWWGGDRSPPPAGPGVGLVSVDGGTRWVT